MGPHSVLFVFAHQDDEFLAATRIRFALEQGADVRCVFLTSGARSAQRAERRNKESCRALAEIGVPFGRIAFLGLSEGIADGKLSEALDRALAALKRYLSHVTLDEIYCLAWEGGHVDHDASHLVALALAKDLGLVHKTKQIYTYNAESMPRGLFRVMKPLRQAASLESRRLSLSDAWATLKLCRHYRSQWKSWLGLLPEASLRLLVGRREELAPVSLDSLTQRPHEGALLYETRFSVRHSDFVAQTRDFCQKQFGTGGESHAP